MTSSRSVTWKPGFSDLTNSIFHPSTKGETLPESLFVTVSSSATPRFIKRIEQNSGGRSKPSLRSFLSLRRVETPFNFFKETYLRAYLQESIFNSSVRHIDDGTKFSRTSCASIQHARGNCHVFDRSPLQVRFHTCRDTIVIVQSRGTRCSCHLEFLSAIHTHAHTTYCRFLLNAFYPLRLEREESGFR